MGLIEKVVKVPENTDKVAQSTFKIIKSVKDALSDGWQPGQDLPKIMTESFLELTQIVQSFDQLDDDYNAYPAEFIKAFGMAGADIANLFIKKDEPPSN